MSRFSETAAGPSDLILLLDLLRSINWCGPKSCLKFCVDGGSLTDFLFHLRKKVELSS